MKFSFQIISGFFNRDALLFGKVFVYWLEMCYQLRAFGFLFLCSGRELMRPYGVWTHAYYKECGFVVIELFEFGE